MKIPENTALLLVDLQRGFENEEHWGGNRNNRDADANAKKILEAWRGAGRPVFHAIHDSVHDNSPLHPANPGNAQIPGLEPIDGEPLYRKNVNSAFIGTDLKADLAAEGIQALVIAGMTTNHCISTTVRMSANLGYKTFLVHDAAASFDTKGMNGEVYSAELVHAVAIANLKDEFADVVSTDEVIEALQ